MPTPGSSSRETREALESRLFQTVEHWRIGTAAFAGDRPAESPASKSPIKIGREGGSDAPFASEEVEAARIMYDAFRATKGPDGELIDTEDWSAETEARVEVCHPSGAFARHPFPLESRTSHAQFIPRRANPPLGERLRLRTQTLTVPPPRPPRVRRSERLANSGNRHRRAPRGVRPGRRSRPRRALAAHETRSVPAGVRRRRRPPEAERSARRGRHPRGGQGHLQRHLRRLAGPRAPREAGRRGRRGRRPARRRRARPRRGVHGGALRRRQKHGGGVATRRRGARRAREGADRRARARRARRAAEPRGDRVREGARVRASQHAGSRRRTGVCPRRGGARAGARAFADFDEARRRRKPTRRGEIHAHAAFGSNRDRVRRFISEPRRRRGGEAPRGLEAAGGSAGIPPAP